MPPYLTNYQLWQALWPIVVIVLFVAAVVSVSAVPSGQRKEAYYAIAAFSMLGITTGYLAAFSREPTLSAVLPAVLSLFGGLAVFLIGQKENVGTRRLVSLCVFVFSLMLVIGAGWGSVMRDEALESTAALYRRAIRDFQVDQLRKQLDAPPTTAVPLR